MGPVLSSAAYFRVREDSPVPRGRSGYSPFDSISSSAEDSAQRSNLQDAMPGVSQHAFPDQHIRGLAALLSGRLPGVYI